MSFKSWPWRSRLRSDTRTPTSTGPLRTARSFRQLGALSVAALSRTPFAKHDGSPAISRSRRSGRVAMLWLGSYETTISGRQATRGGASCRCWWNTPTNSKAPWTLCVSSFCSPPACKPGTSPSGSCTSTSS